MVVIIGRGGSRAAATAKVERFVATYSFKLTVFFQNRKSFSKEIS